MLGNYHMAQLKNIKTIKIIKYNKDRKGLFQSSMDYIKITLMIDVEVVFVLPF